MQLVKQALLAARLVAAVLFPAAQAEIFENLAFLASGVVSETLPFLRALKGRQAFVERPPVNGARFIGNQFEMQIDARKAGGKSFLRIAAGLAGRESKSRDFAAHANDHSGDCEQTEALEPLVAGTEPENGLKREMEGHGLAGKRKQTCA